VIKSESKNLINVKIANRTIQPGNLYLFRQLLPKQTKQTTTTIQKIHKENTPLKDVKNTPEVKKKKK